MEKIVAFLYSGVAFIGLAGYLPQILRLLKAANTDGVSLGTWFIWSVTWLISLSYGIICAQDVLISLVATINLVGHLIIIGIVCIKRYETELLKTVPVGTTAKSCNKKLQ